MKCIIHHHAVDLEASCPSRGWASPNEVHSYINAQRSATTKPHHNSGTQHNATQNRPFILGLGGTSLVPLLTFPLLQVVSSRMSLGRNATVYEINVASDHAANPLFSLLRSCGISTTIGPSASRDCPPLPR